MKNERENMRSNSNTSNGVLSINLNGNNAQTNNANSNANLNNLSAANLNSNHSQSLFYAQRKSTIHDSTQVLIQDCEKLMNECHKTISKYHSTLTLVWNGNLGESNVSKDELKNLRVQSFTLIKTNLEKILPKIDEDRTSLNNNELSAFIQQTISYLEYLKLESARHLYLYNCYSMQSTSTREQRNSISQTRPSIHSQIRDRSDSLISVDANKKIELVEIKKDIAEIESIIHNLSQKYYIIVPNFDDPKGGGKDSDRIFDQKSNSYNICSKFKFICCLCSPKYI